MQSGKVLYLSRHINAVLLDFFRSSFIYFYMNPGFQLSKLLIYSATLGIIKINSENVFNFKPKIYSSFYSPISLLYFSGVA